LLAHAGINDAQKWLNDIFINIPFKLLLS